MIRRLLISLLLLCSLAQAEDLLHPSIAFKPAVRALDGRTIEVRFDIAKGYYLYRDKFRFAAEPSSVQLGQARLPKGKEKMDENFGRVEVYYKEAVIRLPVERNSSGTLPLLLNLTSQGCADVGVCYPPQKQALRLELPDPASAPALTSLADDSGDESGHIAQFLKNADLWLVAASFFGFGLLLSLTPCVFPMIPILSGIIVSSGRDGHGVSHARGFFLSLAYVVGMAVTYALAGIAAGFSGTLISAALQNPWVLGGFALLFVVLAFSMFGFYELQLPTFLQSKVSEEASHFKGGSLPGVAVMGALSALIVGPCVAAPLAGALLYIGQTGDALLGGLALFCMALGMGVPLLVVGLSAGTLLPKSGPWMETVKKAFGFILLATALWLVSPVIPVAIQMAGWAVLLIIPAILMRAFHRLPKQAKGWQRLRKFIAIAMLIVGAVLLAGAFSGGKDLLQAFSRLNDGSKGSGITTLSFERIRSLGELEARIKASGKPVMLDFYADWCVSCKEMARFTFSDARVQLTLSGWILLQADVTANSEDDKALLARFKLFGPPGIIFFDSQGSEVEGVRVVGFQNTDAFLATLARLR
jgi:thiol:disulfide interchange protein DsbD